MHEISQRNQQLASYQRRYSFITTPPTIVDGARSFRYKTGEIEFKNISFIYPEKNTSSKQPKPEITPHPIFDGLSLTIPAGKTTALVGHSGSGKSTLVKLLLRMYDPKKGKIIVDGQPLKSLKRSSLYSHLGYVSQEPAVFDGTIRENLEYGIQNKHKSDEDFWNVLETVRLAEIIRSKPK
jgi:subfamily B ATP-binding cassette protein MsbA